MVGIYNGYLLRIVKDEDGILSVDVVYCPFVETPENIKHYWQENEIISYSTCDEMATQDIDDELHSFFTSMGLELDEVRFEHTGIEPIDNIMWTEF